MTDEESTGQRTSQEELNKAKMYQATHVGLGVAETLARLDDMDVDEYIEAVRAYFIDRDSIEAFMRLLTICKDPRESTVRVRVGTRMYSIRIDPSKSRVFKKSFAEFLVREPKVMFSLYLKDPISLMAYMNARRRTGIQQQPRSLGELFK